MWDYDIVIIGGGPAGLAAAIAAKEEGIQNIIILERECVLGGILSQCVHSGFGIKTFREELTGPEFAQRLIDRMEELQITYKLNTMVLELTSEKVITAVNKDDGIINIKAKAVVMAMGCRECPKGAVNIPGSTIAGIFTAGTAQRFVNIDGYLPGKEVVILGSGDIGLVMARRLTLEGALVKAVVEIMPYPGGSRRNIVECIEDFGIPMLLSHTVVDVKGKERLEGVLIAEVDENKKPVKGREEFITCDTLLLSVGLLPENDIPKKAGIKISKASGGPEVDESLQTSVEGVFACGNLLHVYDWVDDAVLESFNTGRNAASYIKEERVDRKNIELIAEQGIRYTVPGYISIHNAGEFIDIKLRVEEAFENCFISIYFDHELGTRARKSAVSPGDMEFIRLNKDILIKYADCNKIYARIEKE